MILFDSDRFDNSAAKRVFNVTPSTPVRLTAAGLSAGECVPIYQRVKDVQPGTSCEQWTWTQMFRCGQPVQLCSDDNQALVLLPGTYVIGDPTTVPTFAGPVVIETSSLSGIAPEILVAAAACPETCEPGAVAGVQTDWAALRS